MKRHESTGNSGRRVNRYLVTGAAGFVGSHLSEALLRRGDQVVGIDCFTANYPRQLKEANLTSLREASGFTFSALDLAEAPLGPLFVGVDGVFHLAAQPGVRGSWGAPFEVYDRNNILATQRVLEAAAHAGVKVVLASSSSIYGDAAVYPTPESVIPMPLSPYGVTKLAGEHLAGAYARSSGVSVAVLRFFTIYGPRQRPDMALARIVRAVLQGSAFEIYGSGEQSRDFTFVSDAVEAAILTMEDAVAGAVYNVGGGSETSLNTVIQTLEELSGRKLVLERVAAAAGDPRRTSADTTRIRQELEWAPRVTLVDGLAAQLDWAATQLGIGSRGVASTR
jgi:UDP-glucose 4-epimerase